MNINKKPIITILNATTEDGPTVHQLAGSCEALDQNSRYTYLLLCTHFKDHTLVARAEDGTLAGFVSAYAIPVKAETLFIWQVAVAREFRQHGVASRMLDRLAMQAQAKGLRYIEATVTPSNSPSINMLKKFATRFGAEISIHTYFEKELFDGEHEEELLIRIGPLQ